MASVALLRELAKHKMYRMFMQDQNTLRAVPLH
jgi:hypothetical protein